MHLKHLREIASSISCKIFSWYAGVFIFGSVILFAFSYTYFSVTLLRQFHDEILLEFNEVTSLYRFGGPEAVESYMIENFISKRKTPLFVRIADHENRTAHLLFPQYWKDFDLEQLEQRLPDAEDDWTSIPARGGPYVLEIHSQKTDRGQWIQVGMSNEKWTDITRHYREHFVIIMIGLVVFALGGGLLLSSRVLKPIRDIISAVKAIDIGRMDNRIPRSNRNDELDELAMLFNRLLDKISLLVNGMQDSLDNVAHDLRTPLTRIKNTAELMLHSEGVSDASRETLLDIMEETDHILKMIDIVMDLAEAKAGTLRIDRRQTEMLSLVDRIVDMYQFVAEEKGVDIYTVASGDIYAMVDPDRISQAVANLLDNAIKFTQSGGWVRLEVSKVEGQVHMDMEDTGIGIQPEDLPRIWERLYRGDHRRSQKGLGLGLNIVKAIVEAHHGSINAKSIPGKGSVFTIVLPIDKAISQ